MKHGLLTSFLNGFALSGLITRLRRPGAPTHAFAPSVPKKKMILVVDDDQMVKKLVDLQNHKELLTGASYSLVQAEVYILDRCKVG